MLTLIQLSDLHLWEDKNRIYHDRSPVKQLEMAIENIQQTENELCNASNEKVVILTGDLTSHPTPKTYRLLSNILKKLKLPIYAIAGNHDDSQMLDRYLYATNIFSEKEIEKGNWLIILLDSTQQDKTKASGKLTVNALEKLKKLLMKNSQKNVLIFLHHPPILFGAKWFQTVCLENNTEFDEIIQKNNNVKAVIFGHAHTEYHKRINHVDYICAPSTWRQYDHHIHDRSVFTTQLGGYNRYELGEDGSFSFTTHYFGPC